MSKILLIFLRSVEWIAVLGVIFIVFVCIFTLIKKNVESHPQNPIVNSSDSALIIADDTIWPNLNTKDTLVKGGDGIPPSKWVGTSIINGDSTAWIIGSISPITEHEMLFAEIKKLKKELLAAIENKKCTCDGNIYMIPMPENPPTDDGFHIMPYFPNYSDTSYGVLKGGDTIPNILLETIKQNKNK